MQFCKSLISLVGLILLCSFSTHLAAQSAWKFGVGMSLNSSILKDKYDEGVFLGIEEYSQKRGLSVMTRAQKSLSNKFDLSMTPSVNFLTFGNLDGDSKFNSVSISLPVQLNYTLFEGLYIASGVSYNYLNNMSVSLGNNSTDATEGITNRHLLELKHTVGYVIQGWVDVFFSFNHALTPVYDLTFTDFDGSVAIDIESRMQYFQIGFIVRN